MVDISLLTAQYSQQVDPPRLSIPHGRDLVSPTTQSAIYETMFDDTRTWPLPPVPYQTRVLKMILSRIEESICDPEEDEILDSLLEKWTSLLSHPKPSAIQQAQQLSDIKYTAPTGEEREPRKTVITRESRGLILAAGTTGFRTWEAALHLGSYLATDAGASLLRGQRVLELGAGTGFLSLFCAKYLGAESVFATDREPALIEQINHCIGRNGLHGGIQAGIWEWGGPLLIPSSSSSSSSGVRFDIALGADLIYDVDLVPLLVSTIEDLFNNYSLKQFIISATLRNEETFATFIETCYQNNLLVDRIPFESTTEETQTGFFHSTAIPIRTYRVSRA
ncbi:hypothetical protein P175DRAFT_0478154 [Aspergillus ochraceoroseus IBT 24754]|uniref:FAM86 N-terminal domain-containing protein n=1 Tax=Aspergillus ochraceoroseus IBT 24754 TaxID=1392256 RepID=A0A2T5M0X4_9EURO|nr:uncharacterized protein P175DRAFT_0478154 [Aspergillus ochraceoroseus IBT 24754]PTU22178.1 hypothetical protein P175DRAFT_0478154 [Aspergillus ochraceoroseus IBT 24754]